MPTEKTQFTCNQCGHKTQKWLGKCPECGNWNSFHEELVSTSKNTRHVFKSDLPDVTPLSEIRETSGTRIFCGIPELDRVLGGGMVPGALMLLSGDPGIGKSTLLLQTLFALASRGYKVLYASGEESAQQIKLRAERLNSVHPQILITNECNLDAIVELAKRYEPQVLVVDSIQTMFLPSITSSAGSVSQVREGTNQLLQMAKGCGICTWIVGHVTKDGTVAGPKVLEHLVDTVMHFEGDAHQGYRLLRAIKNRFGSTGEVGVFEMQSQGLTEVSNPSSALLNNHRGGMEGSAVGVCMEGTRPLLLEVQSLVGNTNFATPRRLVTGLDLNRFVILLAVLEKRCGLHLGQSDVYANVAGGFKVTEPAIDLAVAAAVTSSFLNKQLDGKIVCFGEVALSGEIRPVTHLLARIQEAKKIGFSTFMLPAQSFTRENSFIDDLIQKESLIVHKLNHIRELVELFLSGSKPK